MGKGAKPIAVGTDHHEMSLSDRQGRCGKLGPSSGALRPRNQQRHDQNHPAGRRAAVPEDQVAEIGVFGDENTAKVARQGQDFGIGRVRRQPIGDPGPGR